jgi:hypothetical protein
LKTVSTQLGSLKLLELLCYAANELLGEIRARFGLVVVVTGVRLGHPVRHTELLTALTCQICQKKLLLTLGVPAALLECMPINGKGRRHLCEANGGKQRITLGVKRSRHNYSEDPTFV